MVQLPVGGSDGTSPIHSANNNNSANSNSFSNNNNNNNNNSSIDDDGNYNVAHNGGTAMAGLYERQPQSTNSTSSLEFPSILPPLTKEIRDDYARHVELLKDVTSIKKKKNKTTISEYAGGVPFLLCTLLVFVVLVVVAYAVFRNRDMNNIDDMVRPPYYTMSPTTVPG